MTLRRLLLADDDEDDRFIFDHVLLETGYDTSLITGVDDGLAAIGFLDEIKDDKELPALIVLDQNMPKMNGKETLSYLKSSNRYLNIPVIIYSTYNDQKFVKECTELGALDVIAKPDSYNDYKEVVKGLLQILKGG